jgi:hypothetical protein
MITQEELKSLVFYDEENGIFIKNKTGKVMGGIDISTGYIKIQVKNVRYPAHRLAWLYVHGYLPKEQVDHINGNRSDNRMCNLREANASQNSLNRKTLDSTISNIKNVNLNKKTGKWRVRCTINKIRTDFGFFDDLEFAELVAKEVMEKYYGQFARI